MTPFRIFIGYDERESIAYHVLAHSILRRASIPVAIIPLRRESLRSIHTRERGKMESTDFSLTRFLVPHLSGNQGVSLYMDCDMLCLMDVAEIRKYWLRSKPYKVSVVKHDYQTKTTIKFLGAQNVPYPRKNWSSLMLFDNAWATALTPDYVDRIPALDLHRFQWCQDNEIGTLPIEWNWLVGEYEPNPDAKIIHYTLGGPWFDETADCDYAAAWYTERDAMLHAGVTV